MNGKSIKESFWRTRQFITCSTMVVVSCLLVGYIVGAWQTGISAQHVIREQEKAYKEAGDARKAVMKQCLDNNAKMSNQLAGLGSKASDAATAAAKALDKISGDSASK